MNPTLIFRWVRVSISDCSHDGPRFDIHGKSLVLQQLFASGYVGVPHEWRDVPIENPNGVEP